MSTPMSTPTPRLLPPRYDTCENGHLVASFDIEAEGRTIVEAITVHVGDPDHADICVSEEAVLIIADPHTEELLVERAARIATTPVARA